MKKTFRFEDLDCANCAAKIENAISQLEGVNKVSVSFLAQKMILDAEDSRFDEIVSQAAKIAKKVDCDCTLIIK